MVNDIFVYNWPAIHVIINKKFHWPLHHFQVDLKSTPHVQAPPPPPPCNPELEKYMPPIDIFVKLKITYIQFSSPINYERLLMINTIIELTWCYMLGYNCYMVGTTMTLWNSVNIGWCCGSCRRLALQLLSPRAQCFEHKDESFIHEDFVSLWKTLMPIYYMIIISHSTDSIVNQIRWLSL